jgi:Glucose-6-phosphate dehydrogenase subunit N-terminal domain/Glucose-6-phosphate dehydrogenase subunit C-terminal domain
VAAALRNTSVVDVERCLDTLEEAEAQHRTSVLTHMVWAPPEWTRAVERVMQGLGPRVPSRTLILHPDPSGADGIDARVEQHCFAEVGASICAEVVHLRLRGRTARVPGSVVVSLLLPDLPAFLRWRGKPPFGRAAFEELVEVADRLIVDSSEWSGLPRAYGRLVEVFDRITVTDLAWDRTLRWRAGLSGLWPEIKRARSLHVTGPRADALLLGGWLRSRLRKQLTVRHTEARLVRRVEVDGQAVRPVQLPAASASDLLSEQLEAYARDPVYEAAVRAV